MKSSCLLLALLSLCVSSANGAGENPNPVSKVLDLLSNLAHKLVDMGRDDQRAYDQFSSYCEVTSKSLKHQIKKGKQTQLDLEAFIEKSKADIAASNNEVGGLAGELADLDNKQTEEAQLRKKEHDVFKEDENVLMVTKNTIERAIAALSRRIESGASLAQLKNTNDIMKALSAMVEATSISTSDTSALSALLQNTENTTAKEDSEDDDDDSQPVYQANRGEKVLDLLNGLLEKTEAQLNDLRKNEMSAVDAFELTKAVLVTKVKSTQEKKTDAQKELAKASEAMAAASGDLKITARDIDGDTDDLKELHKNCMERAQNFMEEVKSRGDEIKALADARKIIQEKTSGAADQVYGGDDDQEAASFIQLKAQSKTQVKVHEHSHSSALYTNVLHIVRRLARDQHSGRLNQLASRMEVLFRQAARGTGHGDPFEKVKVEIEDMITRLQDEQQAAMNQKVFCDREMGNNVKKQTSREDELKELNTAIETANINSKKLKAEVATLQKEVTEAHDTQIELDKLRQEESAQYLKNKPEMKQGLDGVKSALKILRNYYGKSQYSTKTNEAAQGDAAAESIIGLLEVCESDFQKGMAEMDATEQNSRLEHSAQVASSNRAIAVKQEDIKYKSKEFSTLQRVASEMITDKEGVTEELNAVRSYVEQLKQQCFRKAPHEERARRRKAEIEGMKEALDLLSSVD